MSRPLSLSSLFPEAPKATHRIHRRLPTRDRRSEHLQAVAQGRIRNLIINVPPGHAKSLLTAVFWPAWTWIDHPESRWLFSSYREPLATRDSVRCFVSAAPPLH